MHRLLTMTRLSVLFFASFAVLVGGVFAYQALVVAPAERCEAGGGWWDAEGEVCARPIAIAEAVDQLKGLSRAERDAIRAQEAGRELSPAAIRYLNRLSDHLFVAARRANAHGADDVTWVPGATR